MRYALLHPYISVRGIHGGTYGGSQMTQEAKTDRAVGCGVVAALDTILYLYHYHKDCFDIRLQMAFEAPGQIFEPKYNELFLYLRRRYLPLIPGHGINGVSLAIGMNLFFAFHKLPYFASWGVPYSLLWERIQNMLEQDIPVIFSVGPNLPLFWQHHKLPFYSRFPDGSFHARVETHAHYVVVTGMDDQWLRVSSWGRMYFIRRDEFLRYVKEHSARITSNIMMIRKKGHG